MVSFRHLVCVGMANNNTPDDVTDQRRMKMTQVFQSQNSRRRFLQGLGAVGVAGFAGCLGDDDDDDNGETPPEADGRDTMVLNAVQRFGTVDPAKGTDYTQVMAMVNLYDPLVFPDSEGVMQPHLAEDWTISDDGLEYTFELREDVTFHSGNELTAEDVVFSVERMLGINEGYSSLVGAVLEAENVVADDDYTVTMTLDEAHAPFLSVLCLQFIVDKEFVEENGEDEFGSELLDDVDAGSGAYELGSFERGSHIEFVRYDDYFLEFHENSMREVRVDIFDEDSTVLTSMRTGELDMTSQYQSMEMYDTLVEEEDIRVEDIPTATLLYFKMNTQREPTDDIEVRKAIAYGFDYETAYSEITSVAEPAEGPVAPVFDAHNPDVEQPTYDPEYAQEILEDAGYEEGDIEIVFTHVRDVDRQEQNALLFQDNMEDIGIEVEINPQTWGRMTEMATDPEETGHVNHVFYGPVYPSVDAYLFNMYHSEAAATWMSMEHLEDDEVDSLIDQSRSTTDPDEQADLQQQAQARIADLYPSVFVYVETKRHAWHEDIGGYTFRPAMSFDYWWHDYYWNE